MRLPGLRGKRFDEAQRVQRELGVPMLAELSTPAASTARLTAAYDHLFQEVALRTGLDNGERRCYAVTSALEGEGRSCVVVGFALAAARRGFSVLIVDTDTGVPVQHQLLLGDNTPVPGLTELLGMSASSPSEVIRMTAVPGVRVLPIGSVDEEHLSCFRTNKLERFVHNVAPRLADVVVFDVPHVLSNEPGRQVLSLVDATLFVVRLGLTDVGRAKRALEKLEQHQVEVLGSVIVPAGEFPREQVISRPKVLSTLENQDLSTETLSENQWEDATAETVEVEESLSEPDTETAETDRIGTKVIDEMSTSPLEKAKDALGITDLEAVLQGWRRRDSNGPAATPAPTSAESAPQPETVQETEEPMATIKPTTLGVAFPLPGLPANETTDEESDASETPVLSVVNTPEAAFVPESDPIPPVLTMVENPATAENAPIVTPIIPVIPVASVAEASAAAAVSAPAVPIIPIIPVFPPAAAAAEARAETPAPAATMPIPGFPIPHFPVAPAAKVEDAPATPVVPVIPHFPAPAPAAEAADEGVTPEPALPVLPVSVAPVAEPEAEPVVEPEAAPEPEPEAEVVAAKPEPEPVVEPEPEPEPEPVAEVEAAPEPEPVPVVAAAKPEVAAPIALTAPTIAPLPVVPVVPVAPPPPVAAAPAVPYASALASPLDIQIDMFQGQEGEMVMRAQSTNAAAVGYPELVLELGIQMSSLRGMRAITPSPMNGPDQPRIALEAVVTEAAGGAWLRMAVGGAENPALEGILKSGESAVIRTGAGVEKLLVRLEIQPLGEGGSVLRTTLTPLQGGKEVTLELRQEAVTEPSDARWRNRLALHV